MTLTASDLEQIREINHSLPFRHPIERAKIRLKAHMIARQDFDPKAPRVGDLVSTWPVEMDVFEDEWLLPSGGSGVAE